MKQGGENMVKSVKSLPINWRSFRNTKKDYFN